MNEQKLLERENLEEYIKYIESILVETSMYHQYFKEMFVGNSNRAEIMNSTASHFFNLCHNSFFISIILGISKITDPSHSGPNNKFTNLTIRTLLKTFIPIKEDPRRKFIEEKLGSLDSKIETLKLLRNKKIAHLDKESFDKKFLIPIQDLADVVTTLEEVFNLIMEHVPEGLKAFKPNSYHCIKKLLWGEVHPADIFIYLEQGRRYEEMIETLSEERLALLIPEGTKYRDPRTYLQDDVIKYVDRSD